MKNTMKLSAPILLGLALFFVAGCASEGQKETKEVTQETIEQKVDSVSEELIKEIESASENIKQEASEVEGKVNKLLEDI